MLGGHQVRLFIFDFAELSSAPLFSKVNRWVAMSGPTETPVDGNVGGPTSVPLMHPLSLEEEIAAL
jgi:hypothetical protein